MADEATTDTVDESTADSATTEAAATEADPKGAESLSDPGKQALDRMKADRNAAKAEAKRVAEEFAAYKAQAEGKQAEYEQQQKDREVETAALKRADERILKAEVRAQAAGKLADPKDALRFIDLSEFEVDSDGEVDGDKIAAAIADLIKTKPYLAAQGKRFQGDADGGARNDDRKTQLTRDDLSRMTPEQIAQAKKEGRLNDLLGVK
jgi:hypothetical protein